MFRRLLLILLILLIPELSFYGQSAGKKDKPVYYSVTKIVDGDTFWIKEATGKEIKVRLIGVDAPESRNSGRKVKSPFGDASTLFLARMIGGKKVRLEYDVVRKDQYGRILAYVYLESGTFINADMVRNGYATIMTIPPNVKYTDTFVRLARIARIRKRGLWKSDDNQPIQ